MSTRAGALRRYVLGGIRFEVRGDEVRIAPDAMPGEIESVTEIPRGWVFSATGRALARSTSFLGPLSALEAPEGDVVSSRGHVVVVGERVWLGDGVGAFRAIESPAGPRVRTASFATRAFGMAVVEGGDAYWTRDGGASWSRLSSLSSAVWAVAPDGDAIRATTVGAGVFLCRVDGSCARDGSPATPATFSEAVHHRMLERIRRDRPRVVLAAPPRDERASERDTGSDIVGYWLLRLPRCSLSAGDLAALLPEAPAAENARGFFEVAPDAPLRLQYWYDDAGSVFTRILWRHDAGDSSVTGVTEPLRISRLPLLAGLPHGPVVVPTPYDSYAYRLLTTTPRGALVSLVDAGHRALVWAPSSGPAVRVDTQLGWSLADPAEAKSGAVLLRSTRLVATGTPDGGAAVVLSHGSSRIFGARIDPTGRVVARRELAFSEHEGLDSGVAWRGGEYGIFAPHPAAASWFFPLEREREGATPAVRIAAARDTWMPLCAPGPRAELEVRIDVPEDHRYDAHAYAEWIPSELETYDVELELRASGACFRGLQGRWRNGGDGAVSVGAAGSMAGRAYDGARRRAIECAAEQE